MNKKDYYDNVSGWNNSLASYHLKLCCRFHDQASRRLNCYHQAIEINPYIRYVGDETIG